MKWGGGGTVNFSDKISLIIEKKSAFEDLVIEIDIPQLMMWHVYHDESKVYPFNSSCFKKSELPIITIVNPDC